MSDLRHEVVSIRPEKVQTFWFLSQCKAIITKHHFYQVESNEMLFLDNDTKLTVIQLQKVDK